MRRQCRWVVWSLLLLSLEAAALDAANDIKVTPLAKETTSWDGTPITYPQGQAGFMDLPRNGPYCRRSTNSITLNPFFG
jgi:hypothetical protein